jgi:hypothetical protein
MKTLRDLIEQTETSTNRPQMIIQPAEPVYLNISNLEADYLARKRDRIDEIKSRGWV